MHVDKALLQPFMLSSACQYNNAKTPTQHITASIDLYSPDTSLLLHQALHTARCWCLQRTIQFLMAQTFSAPTGSSIKHHNQCYLHPGVLQALQQLCSLNCGAADQKHQNQDCNKPNRCHAFTQENLTFWSNDCICWLLISCLHFTCCQRCWNCAKVSCSADVTAVPHSSHR